MPHALSIHLLVEVFQLQIVYFPKTQAQIAVRTWPTATAKPFMSEAWVYACALAVFMTPSYSLITRQSFE